MNTCASRLMPRSTAKVAVAAIAELEKLELGNGSLGGLVVLEELLLIVMCSEG